MNFEPYLIEQTSEYEGDYSEIINNAPKIYDLLSDLMDIPDLMEIHRLRLLATIGYFILPKDVYPEKDYGAEGFIDDMILSLHTLRDIMQHYSFEILENLWSGNSQSLRRLLNEDFKKLINDKEDMYLEVLDYVGFNRTL